jgi:hypothetical protein
VSLLVKIAARAFIAAVVAMLSVAVVAVIIEKYEQGRGNTPESRKAALHKIMTAVFWIGAALSILIPIAR